MVAKAFHEFSLRMAGRAAAAHQFKFFETPPPSNHPRRWSRGVTPQLRVRTFRAAASAALRTAIHSFAISLAPEVPTADEAGLPGFYTSVWSAIWAPKGTPKHVIGKLNAAIVEALAAPATRQRLVDLGDQVVPREEQAPERLRALHEAEIDKWWPIIKAANIKAE